jgi:hypothetical protein
VVRWLQSYLAARTATPAFNEEESAPIQVQAGVPRGFPLSPIPFLLYVASLYEALGEVTDIMVIGFADNPNIVGPHKKTAGR